MQNIARDNERTAKKMSALYVIMVIIILGAVAIWTMIMFASKQNSFIFEENMAMFYSKCVNAIIPELASKGSRLSFKISNSINLFLIYSFVSALLWLLQRIRFRMANIATYKESPERGLSLIRFAIASFLATSAYGFFLHYTKSLINLVSDKKLIVDWWIGTSFSFLTLVALVGFCKLYRKFPRVFNKEIILYVVFGGITTVVNIASFNMMRSTFNANTFSSNVVAWVISVTFAYIANKALVFNSENDDIKSFAKELGLFVGARITSLLVDILIIWLLIDILSMGDGVSKILSNVVVMIMNYIFSKKIIFKKKL